ncbi:uncharacterized protein LOC116251438 [Nymphaea colorata]|nr:uncharacterized protein LOC116251438 [Nymphaea colorata]
MSAIVCGKRSIFEELHTPPPVSKRLRCSGSTSPIRFSPTRVVPSAVDSPLSQLRQIFPDMDEQLLERALEACGNDLDSAIKSLNELRLGERSMASIGSKSENKLGEIAQQSSEVLATNIDESSNCPAPPTDLPSDGSEWVELFVREMMNATDVNDARLRASKILEVLEKSIMSRAGEVVSKDLHKENLALKEQVEVLVRENQILKRAVAIQHERQKEYDERGRELEHLKQLVAQYQEQVRTLEVNNYALTVYLQQAQQSSSIPGRFHPDVF